jgi:hypothetical protein
VAISADIKAAYRGCPILAAHKRWLVSSTRSPSSGLPEFWLDHCAPFGLRSAHGILGEIVDASLDILVAEAAESGSTVDTAKWVDDIVAFLYPCGGAGSHDAPWRYLFQSRDDLLALIGPLRIPWHETKGQREFSHIVAYLGFLWDLWLKQVALPDEKRTKYFGRVKTFLTLQSVALEEVLKLHGFLSHLVFVIPEGRSYLPSLSSFAASFSAKPARRSHAARLHPPRSVKRDLDWWASALAKPVPPRPLVHARTPVDLGIWVDASTNWGIGLIWEHTRWDAWRSLPGWEGAGRHITWLECIAAELVVIILDRLDVRDSHVLIRSDNQGVIGAFAKGRCPSFEINLSIRRAMSIALARNLTFDFQYVASAINLADPISRGEFGPAHLRFASDITLPDELKTYFVYV